MDIGHAILKAVVQGLTEFLPVSSTAHLIFTDTIAKAMGWQAIPVHGEEEFYDILLHLGTLSAVIVYFRREIGTVLLAMLGKLDEHDLAHQENTGLNGLPIKQLPWLMAASMTVTVVWILAWLKGSEVVFAQMGWATDRVHDIHEFYMANPKWVAGHLMITGCLLFFTEQVSAKANRKPGDSPFTLKNALTIGLFQGCAGIFHGISRSGSTISGGLISGTDRLTATRYSFLLSIPTFVMAAVYEAKKMLDLQIGDHLNWPAMGLGMVVTALVGYFCVKYFIQFVASHSLKGFAVYCWIVGTLMLLALTQQTPLLQAH